MFSVHDDVIDGFKGVVLLLSGRSVEMASLAARSIAACSGNKRCAVQFVANGAGMALAALLSSNDEEVRA